jgi:protein-disulfide isomerase
MVEHGLGVAMAFIILTGYRPRPAPDQTAAARKSRSASIILATAAFGLFVTAQWLSSPPSTTQRLPEGSNLDTGPGPNRRISVLQGKLQLAANEEPLLGSPDASKLLCLMFDYCCPHCRRTHAYLRTALDEFAGELAIVSLPMPRDADCNPTIEQTEERFENSCELTRLALAVWMVDPQAFPDYDQWLFESSKPRSVAEARAHAEQLVSADQLEAAVKDASIDERIARNIDAYQASGAQYIPILMSPGFDTVVGRPESEEALLTTLRDELFTQGPNEKETEETEVE